MNLTPELAKAQKLYLSQRFTEALPLFRKVAAKHPNEPVVWMDMGSAAFGAREYETAVEALKNACRLAPGEPSFHRAAAQIFSRLRMPDMEEAARRQVLSLMPHDPAALGALASLLERQGRLDEADVVLATANAPSLDILRGAILGQRGDLAAAAACLRRAMAASRGNADVDYPASRELAKVLERSGQCDEAMLLLEKTNEAMRRGTLVSRMRSGFQAMAGQLSQLTSSITQDDCDRWREAGADIPMSRPVALLCGHPRSGTTLMEALIEPHPGITALEEITAFSRRVFGPLIQKGPDWLATLRSLKTPECSRLARGYFQDMEFFLRGADPARCLLDKNPSETLRLAFWSRVLPAARLLVMLRDPRDVVLSCYFTSLPPNEVSVNYLTLEETARHYALLMDVWLRQRALLPPASWLEVRYEDVAAQSSVWRDRVFHFLDLAAMESPHLTSTSQVPFSPNYRDARQAPHQRSVNRWHRYARWLEPVMPLLAPYCRALGYPV